MPALMDRGLHLILVVAIAVSCAKSTGEGGAKNTDDRAELSPGSFRAIIGIGDRHAPTDSTLTPEQIEQLASLVADRHGLRIERVLTLVSAFAAIVDSSALGELRADTNVRYVEPDRLSRPSRDTEPRTRLMTEQDSHTAWVARSISPRFLFGASARCPKYRLRKT